MSLLSGQSLCGMQHQSSFRALSLGSTTVNSPSVSNECTEYLGGYGTDVKITHVQENPSIMVHSNYPYRICEASASFADVLGFKPKELQGGSLRLFFGPETDLHKLKKIVSDEGQGENDRVVLYQKDGSEVSCSIHCTKSDLPSWGRVSSISILNYRFV